MKITETNFISSLTRKKVKKNDGSGFSLEVGETEESSSAGDVSNTSASTGVFSLDMMNALNNFEDPVLAKKKGIDWGKNVLDDLEKVKIGIIFGKISEETLQQIEVKLDSVPASALDGRLLNLLEEIKTRAAVEIEKLKRYQDGSKKTEGF